MCKVYRFVQGDVFFLICVFYTLKLALHNHYFPFWRQFFVLCLCNKTVKDLESKKRDRDRETVTLGPAAPYVTIIWGGASKCKNTKIQNAKIQKYKNTKMQKY